MGELGHNVHNTENIHGVGTDETTGAQLAIIALAADKPATTPERTGPIPLLAPVSRVTALLKIVKFEVRVCAAVVRR